ncbi:MAG: hypothetical protein M1136_06095 [Chloroflexi bacterium]|nr:hypothetical protein [Chloroflexota bacterium]
MGILRIGAISFVQALALALYCWAVAWLLFSQGAALAQMGPTVGMIFFLLLFVISAIISASLVLGYPGYLVWAKRVGQGLKILALTVAWLVLFLALIGVGRVFELKL